MKAKSKEEKGEEVKQRNILLNIIHESIAEYYCITKRCVFETSRKKDIIPRKQWFQYLAYTSKIKMSYSFIGAYYSDKTFKIYDHATVRHNVNYIKDSIELYKSFKKTKKDLKALINFKIENYKEHSKEVCAPCKFEVKKLSA